MSAVLELRGIEKRYGAVHALRGVDFRLRRGEVHALLGENGAGKTTLMQVAYGLVRPDAGTVLAGEARLPVRSPRDARESGIGMVHQHFTSVPALTVQDNIALVAGKGAERRLVGNAVFRALSSGLEQDALVEDLSVGSRQRLEIVKALSFGAQILLLDEPTAVLAPEETRELLRLVREFAEAGGSVVLITHKLREVFDCADRVTVLRRGAVAAAGDLADQTIDSLAAAMIGGAPPRERQERGTARIGGRVSPAVTMKGVTVPPLDGRGPGLRDATLSLAEGELVGLAAIDGNGQRELMLTVAGLLVPTAGTLEVRGPISLVPEDRVTEGLVVDHTVTENVLLGLLADRDARQSCAPRGWIDWDTAEGRTRALLQRFKIQPPEPGLRAGALSGGNQQKLVLGRALETRPRVVVAENPTRGLDIQAAAEVREHLRRVASEGATVLFYSSDLDEVLELGVDRLMVVAAGGVTELVRTTDRDAVGRALLGSPGDR